MDDRGTVMTRQLLGAAFILAFCLMAESGSAFAQSAAERFRDAQGFQFDGFSDAAVREYRRGLALNPRSVDGHTRLGVLLLDEKGDLQGAIDELATAVGLDPSCAYCQARLDEALERENSNPSEQVARGNQAYSSGQLNRAVAAYRVAIYLDPVYAEARNCVAWSLYRMGELDEAMRQSEESLRLRPDDPEYINTEACILYDRGNIVGAIEKFAKAISLSKSPGAADLYGLAISYLAQGKKSDAAREYEEAIKIDPNYSNADYLRSRVGLSVKAIATHDQLTSLTSKEKAGTEQKSDGR